MESKKIQQTTNKEENTKLGGKYIEAIGRRKRAVARVRFYDNKKKKITINNKEYQKFLPTFELVKTVEQPLQATGYMDASVTVIVKGGGIRGQADAISHGIARTLIKLDPELRTALKPLGYLTRDPREKERKKPGLKKARRAPQWAKR
ncbi:MAG: 30S ribosomal protein S9 [Patescibacteria group bacterium]